MYIFAPLQSSRKSHCLNLVSLCGNTSSLNALVLITEMRAYIMFSLPMRNFHFSLQGRGKRVYKDCKVAQKSEKSHVLKLYRYLWSSLKIVCCFIFKQGKTCFHCSHRWFFPLFWGSFFNTVIGRLQKYLCLSESESLVCH